MGSSIHYLLRCSCIWSLFVLFTCSIEGKQPQWGENLALSEFNAAVERLTAAARDNPAFESLRGEVNLTARGVVWHSRVLVPGADSCDVLQQDYTEGGKVLMTMFTHDCRTQYKSRAKALVGYQALVKLLSDSTGLKPVPESPNQGVLNQVYLQSGDAGKFTFFVYMQDDNSIRLWCYPASVRGKLGGDPAKGEGYFLVINNTGIAATIVVNGTVYPLPAGPSNLRLPPGSFTAKITSRCGSSTELLTVTNGSRHSRQYSCSSDDGLVSTDGPAMVPATQASAGSYSSELILGALRQVVTTAPEQEPFASISGDPNQDGSRWRANLTLPGASSCSIGLVSSGARTGRAYSCTWRYSDTSQAQVAFDNLDRILKDSGDWIVRDDGQPLLAGVTRESVFRYNKFVVDLMIQVRDATNVFLLLTAVR